MSSSSHGVRNIVLPPMPKPEDFGIEWENTIYNLLTNEGLIASFQIKMYREAMASWEKVCTAAMTSKVSDYNHQTAT